MAQQADGTIYIDTKINSDGVTAGSKEIENALKKTADTVSKIGNSMNGYSQEAMKFVEEYADNMGKASEANNEFLREIENAKAALKELEGQGKWFGDEDYDNAVLDLERLEKAVKEYKKELLSPTPDANPFDLDSYAGQIREAEIELSNLAAAGKGLGNEEFDEAYRKLALLKNEAKEYRNELAKTPDQIEKEAQKMEELRVKEEAATKEAERLKAIGDNAEVSDQHIVDLNNELQALKERQADLNKAGVGGLGFAEFEQNASRISEIQQELKEYQSSLSEAESKTSKFGGVIKNAFSKVASAAKTAVSKLGNAAKSAAKTIGGKLVSGVKKAGSAMLGLNKSTKKSNDSLGLNLKNILKYAFGIGSLMKLFNKLRSAAKEGFKNLAQFDGKTNASISSLMSALTQLKNSLATAFAPILNIVAPILSSFINMLSHAATRVGMLIVALTGQKSFTKATKVQEDYAASLGDTADAAEEAKKGLASYDKLSVISENEETKSSDYTAPTPQDMFETVPIESSIKGLADKIKTLMQSEDWEGIGTLIADGINVGMAKVKKAISWQNVSPTVTKFVTRFTGVFNSLVSNLNWVLLGQTIGEGINTVVNMLNMLVDGINWENLGTSFANGLNGLFSTVNAEELGKLLSQKIRLIIDLAYGFVTQFDWRQFGTWIGTAINGFFNNIDFGKLAKTLSKGIIGAFNSLSSAIQEIDWYELGQKVKEFLVNIDWGGIASAMFEAIGSALAGLALFIWGLIEDAWNSIVEWWHDVAFEDGKFTIKGLLNGIKEVLKNISKWINKNIFDPFIKGFKKVFGIHSPSTVMAEQGGFIISGLLNGLKDKFSGVKEWLSKIPEKFKAAASKLKEPFSKLKDFFEKVWDGVVSVFKSPINTIIGFVNKLIEGVASIVNDIGEMLNSLSFDLPDWGILGDWAGKSIGFNFGTWTPGKIPYLASGAVIPPNAPFMAVLGDQKHGTNIEAPLSTITEAVLQALQALGFGETQGREPIMLTLDKKVVAKAVWDENLKRYRQTGNLR